MKTRHNTLLSLTGTLLCSLTTLTAMNAACAADTSLNVYNWSDYIAKDTIANFEKQSGINVKYDSYDSDDTLQAKLLAGSSGYDIVVPTSSYMARQIEAGVYQKIDKSKMPNLANLDPGPHETDRRCGPRQSIRRALGVGHGRHRL
ncbi:spermidine/putrescine-binding protein [Paraburkholderia bryophila]|uniref:Spermidine/putrescine-binding protein n=1 Tax=Paraburkholderia bryophila TaxID=420952 RepID=A0A7Y9W7E7_9BURK|nr:spermidine/putrescine-binding protein [Paraburkholderia bryophila]